MPKLLAGPLGAYAGITLLIAAMTAVMHPFDYIFDLVNTALIYLFPVLTSAVLWGQRHAFFASFLSVLAFDFFFVPPFLSFGVEDLRYLVTFGVYLTVAAVTAGLAARLKRLLRYSRQREEHTAALYLLSRQIGEIADIHALLDNVAAQVARTIGADNVIYLPDERNRLIAAHRSPAAGEWGQGDAERAIARLAFDHGEPAGYGSGTLRDSPGYYFPLRAEDRVYGVLALNLQSRSGVGEAFTAERRQLLEALGGLAASAIARARLAEEAKLAHLTAESERLRAAILDSVSHELRTPLAAVIGAATGLIEGDKLFTSEDRMELLLTVRDGALRMNRLVVNLLSMVRLESGMLRLRRNWCAVEDLIGVTLAQVKELQQRRTIRVRLPEAVPLVSGDEVLLEQMLVNVVGNAIKYSPDESGIELSVRVEGKRLVLSVADQGIGLADGEYERIFEKFYRSDATRQTTGTGLGLAICKGIVELHGGTIAGRRNEPQGTVITIALPLAPGKREAPRELPLQPEQGMEGNGNE